MVLAYNSELVCKFNPTRPFVLRRSFINEKYSFHFKKGHRQSELLVPNLVGFTSFLLGGQLLQYILGGPQIHLFANHPAFARASGFAGSTRVRFHPVGTRVVLVAVFSTLLKLRAVKIGMALFNLPSACPEKADISLAFQCGHFICLLHATGLQIDILCFGAYGLAGGDS